MADTDTFDPFALGSGLIDDVDVAFKDCTFGYDAAYNDGQTLLFMAEAIVDGDDGPSEERLMFPCGTGWEPAEKGQRAKREDGKKKNFNKSSGYGLLIGAAVECGAGDILRSRDPENGPMNASIWDGLIFHMKRREISYGGEIGTKERLLPVEFKGEATGGAKKASGATKKAAAAPKADESDDGAELSAKLKVLLRKKAEEVAASDGSHDAFMEAAFEIDGVADNAAAEAAVMADDDDSIWGKAVAAVAG